jgi:uncharacterized protein (DUF3820 family)
MPFGKHKDKRMIDVPAFYLLYIYDNNMVSDERVRRYIIENLDALKKETGRGNR